MTRVLIQLILVIITAHPATWMAAIDSCSLIWFARRPVRFPRVLCILSHLLLDAHQLVILCQPLRSAGRPGLNLSRRQSHRQIGNVRILGLSRPVARHHTPSRLLGNLHRLDRLRQRPNLVHLEQQRIARLLLNRLLDSSRVRNQQIIAHQLNAK